MNDFVHPVLFYTTMNKLLLILIILLTSISSCKQAGHFPMPADIPLKLNLEGNFSLTKQYDTGSIKNYVFKSANECVIISAIPSEDENTAMTYRNDKLSLVNSLFADQGTPYPGKVTNHQGCPDEYKPVVVKDTKELYILNLKANERFVYGGCTDASAYYSSALVFCYCSNSKTLFELKYFTPVSSSASILKSVEESVSCL